MTSYLLDTASDATSELPFVSYDETVLGNERFNPMRFIRDNYIFRIAHIGKRIVTIGKDFQLGTGSLLHLLDDYTRGIHSDVPDVDGNPFVVNESFKKWFISSTDFVTNGPLANVFKDEKYIYRTPGLAPALMKFKTMQKAKFRYLYNIEDIPMRMESLTIVNHNPLMRAFCRGQLATFRRNVLVLASIVNTAAMINGKTQYIHLPLSDEIFTREMFNRSKTTISRNTIVKPESFHWFIMMEILHAVTGESTSIFSGLDEEVAKKLNFIFTVPASDDTWNAIFLNLSELQKMQETTNISYRLINHFNLLAASTYTKPEVLIAETEAVLDDGSVTPEIKYEPTTEEEQKAAVVEKQITNVVSKKEQSSVPTKIAEVTKSAAAVATKTVKEIVKKAAASVKPDRVAVSAAASKTVAIEKPIVNYAKVTAPTVKPAEVVNKKVAVPTDTSYVKAIEQKALAHIESRTDLTPKQKERCIGLLAKKDAITFNGKKMTDLLVADVVSLPEKDLNALGTALPDKSLGKSSLDSFDKSYLAHTMDADTAKAIYSLSAVGMYVTNIQTEDHADELNHIRTYKVQFEEYTGEKHSIKFHYPVVSRNGTCVINGTSKFIKKQILTLPICKVSATRVSLASNYNKTIVERNVAKARSYLPYISKVIDLGIAAGSVDVVYGLHEVNACISYEYNELMKKFTSVAVKQPNGEVVTFYFGYTSRYDHIDIEQSKLSNLEASYGIFTGTYNKAGKISGLLFVDVDNNITVTDPGGKVISDRHSYLSILLSAYTEENKKKITPLYEWVDLKVLDKNFPIIFILAYKYGLQATLEYLGVPYVLRKKRSKVILDTDAANAKYNYVSKVPHSEDIDDLGLGDKYVAIADVCALAHGCDIESVSRTVLLTNLKTYTAVLESGKLRRQVVDGRSCLSNDDQSLILIGDDKLYGVLSKNAVNISGVMVPGYKDTIAYLAAAEEKEYHAYAQYLKDNAKVAEGVHESSPSDIVIKFQDLDLIVDRYPLSSSFIVAGLALFNTDKHFFAEFNEQDVYYTLLVEKGYRTNYLYGIDALFSLFIDSITYDVLKQMGEPTEFRDLLIRATQMLVTEDHLGASSVANHRIRSYEQFNAILYNEISRQYAGYMKKKTKGTKFSINPEAVFQRIIKNETLTPHEVINPVQSMKEQASITYAGIGGRTSESFVIEDRKYPADGVGTISPDTVDSGKVAINATLSLDPAVVNTRGILIPRDVDKVTPAQVLSPATVLMPCVVNDDSKRKNFIAIQMGHVIPTVKQDICRVRTGGERFVAQRCGDNFAGVARGDGVVTSINHKARMIKVDYKSGETDIFTYGDEYHEISGFYVAQQLVINVAEGQKVKEHDIICYNPNFFKLDPIDKQLDWSHGVDANVVLIEAEGSQEDSNEMTLDFSKKLGSRAAAAKVINLNATDIIHEIVSIGDEVYNTDQLLIFEEGSTGDLFDTIDDATKEMLAKINRKIPKAGHSGTIARIEAYYSCELEDMSPSIRKVVDAACAEKNAQVKFARGTTDESSYHGATKIAVGTRYKGVTFERDTVVLIFFISGIDHYGAGDKCVIANQLKTTTMGIMEKAPFTESGAKVDIVFSGNKVHGRIVLSAFIVGIANRVLERAEDNAVSAYFDDY